MATTHEEDRARVEALRAQAIANEAARRRAAELAAKRAVILEEATQSDKRRTRSAQTILGGDPLGGLAAAPEDTMVELASWGGRTKLGF